MMCLVIIYENVLLVDDAVVRQYLHRLYPCGVYRLIFSRCDGIEFGQLHPKPHRDVGVLADDAAMFHRKQWKLALQCTCF